MEIQKRDLKILKFCLEQKFATLLQISNMFFSDSRNIFHRPVKRVCELVHAGLLRAEQLRVCEKKLYVTTRAGVKLLKQNGLGSGLRAVDGLDARTLEHDELVTDVRIIFDRLLGLSEWAPERVLKQKAVHKKVPDGIVAYQGQSLVIEVERTLKSKKCYEKLFYSYYTRNYGEERILYVMSSKTDMKWLMNEAKIFEQILFATIEYLNYMPEGCAVFVSASHGYLEFRLEGFGGVHFKDALDVYDHWETDLNRGWGDEENPNAHIDGLEDLRKADAEARALTIEYERLEAKGLSKRQIDQEMKSFMCKK